MSIIKSEMMCQPNAIPLGGLEIHIDPEYAKYLTLAIKDRIRHGRHFTLKNEFLALTFVSELVTGDGVVVSKRIPYALYGYWIQVRHEMIIRITSSTSNSSFFTMMCIFSIHSLGINHRRPD